jgi:phosphoglycerate dehydrogenase-like enzyme
MGRRCDVVSIRTPLTVEARKMIGAEAFAAANKGMILMHMARGLVVDVDALYGATQDGIVLAAGLDLLLEEPVNARRQLIAAWHKNDNWIRHCLLLTPHPAFFMP